jgi:hypothetical protein
MIRLLCGGFALVLATALVPQGTLPADAAEKSRAAPVNTAAPTNTKDRVKSDGGMMSRFMKLQMRDPNNDPKTHADLQKVRKDVRSKGLESKSGKPSVRSKCVSC